MTIKILHVTEHGRDMNWTSPPNAGQLLQSLLFTADEPIAAWLLANPALIGPWHRLGVGTQQPATLLRALGEVPDELRHIAPRLRVGVQDGRPHYVLSVLDPNDPEGAPLTRPEFACMDCTGAAVWCEAHRAEADDHAAQGVRVDFYLVGLRFPVGDHAPSAG